MMAFKQTQPIELYYWTTPNGHKVTIALEELGIPYDLRFVNIGKGEQFNLDFLAISPNNRIPAIVDPQGPGGKSISIFESAAILQYLGRKFGRFYPTAERARVEVEEWLAWQVANVGPAFGQNNHFSRYAPERLPYAITRFVNEVHRLYGILDRRLNGRQYVAAGEYTIADMALLGWIRNPSRRDVDIAEFPNVARWIEELEARPAVQRALAIKAPVEVDLAKDAEAQKILFNQR
jgi:GST-like protein